MSLDVPIIDISAYTLGGSIGARDEVARQIDKACTEVGFMQIVGHGIPESVTEGLGAAMDEFFSLPLRAKKAYKLPPELNRGYTPPKSESLSLSLGVESATRMNDFFEAFNVGATARDYLQFNVDEDYYAENVWPLESDSFEPQVRAYFRDASRVAHTMVRIFTDALGLPVGYFDAFTSHSIDVLRMNNYALPEGTDVALDGDLTGMGEHTDFGIVTVLWADQVKGLQVLASDGSWNDVTPVDGALLINLGDLTARWTNERWMSTLHRVKPPLVDGTIQRRRSAAFFHDGNSDARIETLPSCVDEAHPNLYVPVTVAEHITAKLNGSRAGVANTDAAREAARVLQSSKN
ncbi:2-oxoglutarate and iron-dependent oxygenase domain-containing protein [soil metagenome]